MSGVGAVASTTSAVLNYKTAQEEKVEVTTISKECHLYHYVQVQCSVRNDLRKTNEGKDLLRSIADNNKLIVTNCPNLDKPEALKCQQTQM